MLRRGDGFLLLLDIVVLVWVRGILVPMPTEGREGVHFWLHGRVSSSPTGILVVLPIE